MLRQATRSKWRKFGVYALDSHATCHRCRLQYGARPVVGDCMGAEPWLKGQHCRARSGAHMHYRSWASHRFCCYLRLCAIFLAVNLTRVQLAMQTAHWHMLAVHGNTHTGPRDACFPENFAFPRTVEQVVPSRKLMKSKTKPEEPSKKEGKFVCKAEHWESATPSHCKTQSVHPKVVSQSIRFTATRRQAYELGPCLQEFMLTAGVRC